MAELRDGVRTSVHEPETCGPCSGVGDHVSEVFSLVESARRPSLRLAAQLDFEREAARYEVAIATGSPGRREHALHQLERRAVGVETHGGDYPTHPALKAPPLAFVDNRACAVCGTLVSGYPAADGVLCCIDCSQTHGEAMRLGLQQR